MDWNDVPTLSWRGLNKNEQRAMGGFLAESEYEPEEFDLIQVEVPTGLQRTHGLDIDSDLALEEILSKGFLTENMISRRWGALVVAGAANIDAITILKDYTYIIEIKTREQKIKGTHDIYEGFGQVLMNLDRFEEDYPSICQEKNIRGLLLAEDSEIDVHRIKPSFIKRDIGLFDPRREGFLIKPW